MENNNVDLMIIEICLLCGECLEHCDCMSWLK